MSTEGSKPDFMSLSKDTTVSEDLQSSQSVVIAATREESSNPDFVASKSTSGEEVLAVNETTSASNADKPTSRESYSASANVTEESSDASVVSSANEESGDSGTSFVKRIRKVSFAARVCEDNDAAGTSRDLTTPTRVAGELEDTREFSIETVNPGCCPEHRGLIGYFRVKMMYFRESKYLLPFRLALLAMPIVSGFKGAEYMYSCPASPAVAILFFMMGIIGTPFLCRHIYNGFKRALFPNSNWQNPTDDLPIAGLLLLGVLFTTELACFFNMEPEFTHTRASAKFCDENFYYFARWMNYSGITLVILLMLLYCPGIHPCTRTHVPHVTHELLGGMD